MDQTSGPAYKIVAYTSDVWEHVCPTIRLIEPITEAGMQLIKGNDWDNGLVQIRLNHIEEADLVVIQRDFPKHVEAYEEIMAYARRLKKPVVYEIDDNLAELGISHPDADTYLEPRPSILRAVLEADAITTSSSYLADYLRVFNPNVFILPNFLVEKFWMKSDFESISSSDRTPITIGYMGGHSHKPDIEMVIPVLERLLDRYGDQISIQFWGLHPGIEFLNRPNVHWTHPYLVNYAEFARYFMEQTCDIFIAPLQDNLFNCCKSGLKYLEYSILGIPGVYSNLPPYNKLITDGENGFLAGNLAEWENSISQLIENSDLRSRMGNAAQSAVKKRELLSQNAHRWQDAYRQIVGAFSQDRKISWENAQQLIKKSQSIYVELAQKASRQIDRIRELEKESARSKELIVETQRLSELEKQAIKLQLDDNAVKLKANGHALNRLQRNIDNKNQQLNQLDDMVRAMRMNQAVKIQELGAMNYHLQLVQNSTAWKFTNWLIRLRMSIAPNGSFRERLLRRLIIAYRIWREQGFRAVASIIKNKLIRTRPGGGPSPVPGISPSQNTIQYVVVDGIRCQKPAISFIYLVSSKTTSLEIEKFTDWLSRQTWTDWEFVFWNPSTATGWMINQAEDQWDAPDLSHLLEETRGKYVCFASMDLVLQRETFIEENLIALESENLAFTININGKPDWVLQELRKGLIPGSLIEPFQRMVVNKKCVCDHYELNLTSWFSGHNLSSMVVGKVIFTTSNEIEPEGRLVFVDSLRNYHPQLFDHSLIAHRPGNQENGNVLHPLHSIDMVLPDIKRSFDLPTVLMFMPFLAVGGAERIALDVIRCLKDEIQFIILTMDEHDPAIGTTTDLFRELTPYVFNGHDFINPNLNFSMINYIINRFQPMTLYIANGSPWIYDALMTIKKFHPGLRLVNQVYDHQTGWINRYDPTIAQIVDDHIASNKKIINAYLDKGVREEAVSYIENGINEAEFDPSLYTAERCASIKMKLNLPVDRKIITFMARLHPQKRPMDFVEIARRFSGDASVHFLMVGDGVLGKSIEEEINRIGLENITRIPFYRPSSDIFAVSDIYILPSEYEGMPMVVLEAQAMGKPVVVTDVGNTREILEKTQGGIIIDKPGDISAFRLAIHKLLEDSPNPHSLRQVILDNNGLDIYKKYKLSLIGP